MSATECGRPPAGTTWAVVPVKSLALGKSRLAPVLTGRERANLIRRLLRRTVLQLRAVAAVDEILVVSHDPQLRALATALAVRVAAEPAGAGLNVAVSRGYQLARAHGAARVLVLPADLPFMAAADVDVLLAALTPPAAGLGLVICSDEARQGTNALGLAGRLPDELHCQFGPDSFARHLQLGQTLAAAVQIVTLPGIQFDLDTAADWGYYLARRSRQPDVLTSKGELHARKS